MLHIVVCSGLACRASSRHHGGAYRVLCTAVCRYNTVLDVWWKFHVSTLCRALPGAPYSEHRPEHHAQSTAVRALPGAPCSEHRPEHHAQSTAVRARLSQLACEPAMPFRQGHSPCQMPASPASPACSQETAHPRAMADMAMAPRLVSGQGAVGPQLQHLYAIGQCL